jgi:hypothetical protein
MTLPTIEQLEAMLANATKGPWGWFGYPDDLKLATKHSGRIYVMDFVRKGMRFAQPRFHPSGRGMVNAAELLKFEVGDRDVTGEKAARADGSVYRYDVIGIDNADAALIALAPTLASQRIADAKQIAELEAENGRITNQRDYNRRLADYQKTVIDRLNAEYDALRQRLEATP